LICLIEGGVYFRGCWLASGLRKSAGINKYVDSEKDVELCALRVLFCSQFHLDSSCSHPHNNSNIIDVNAVLELLHCIDVG
jgi:hypothetical protein